MSSINQFVTFFLSLSCVPVTNQLLHVFDSCLCSLQLTALIIAFNVYAFINRRFVYCNIMLVESDFPFLNPLSYMLQMCHARCARRPMAIHSLTCRLSKRFDRAIIILLEFTELMILLFLHKIGLIVTVLLLYVEAFLNFAGNCTIPGNCFSCICSTNFTGGYCETQVIDLK